LDGPRVAANQPTPWIGVKERVSVYAFHLWVMMLAIVLWRVQGAIAEKNPI
jgi:hypothetical protein